MRALRYSFYHLSTSVQEATEHILRATWENASQMLSRHSKFISVRYKIRRSLSTILALYTRTTSQVCRHISSYISVKVKASMSSAISLCGLLATESMQE